MVGVSHFFLIIYFYIGVVSPSLEKFWGGIFFGRGEHFFQLLLKNVGLQIIFLYFPREWPMSQGNSSHIYFFFWGGGTELRNMTFSKMAAQKACVHDNIWTVCWIAFKFAKVGF